MKNQKLLKLFWVYLVCLSLAIPQASQAETWFSRMGNAFKNRNTKKISQLNEAHTPNILTKWENPKFPWSITMRATEIQALVQKILGSAKVTVLIGKPKVGKTAIVAGAAQSLKGKKIETVNLETLITAERGIDKPEMIKDIKMVQYELNRILDSISRNGNALFIEDIHSILPKYAQTGSNRILTNPFDGEKGKLREAVRDRLIEHIRQYPGKIIVEVNKADIADEFEHMLNIGTAFHRMEIEEPTVRTAIAMLEKNKATITTAISSRKALPLRKAPYTDEGFKTLVAAAAKYRNAEGLPGSAITLAEDVAVAFFNKSAKHFQTLQFFETEIQFIEKEFADFTELNKSLTHLNGAKKWVTGKFANRKVKDFEANLPTLRQKLSELIDKKNKLEEIYNRIPSRLAKLEQLTDELENLEPLLYKPDANTTKVEELIVQKQTQIKAVRDELEANYAGINHITGRTGSTEIGAYDVAEFIANELGHGHTPESILQSLQDELTLPSASLVQNFVSKVINQIEAITKVFQSLKRASLGLRDKSRPYFSGLFLGSSATGKTNFAEQLTKMMNNGASDADIYKFLLENHLPLSQSNKLMGNAFQEVPPIIKVPGNEYREAVSVSRVTGASPNYIGGEADTILQQIKKCKGKFCIVLLDEFEKAHPDVQQLWMDAMDKGVMTTGYGEKISFSNVAIIATSNAITTKDILKAIEAGEIPQEILSKPDELKKFAVKFLTELSERKPHLDVRSMKPEVLGRFDHILIFNEHNIQSLIETAKNVFQQTFAKLLQRNKKIDFEIDDDALKKLAQISLDSDLGARSLRANWEQKIEDMCADVLTNRQVNSGETLRVMATSDGFRVVRVLEELHNGKPHYAALLPAGTGRIVRND